MFCLLLNFLCLRMSDIISRRQRTPWFWPDFVYNFFGEGWEHDKNIKILHSFTNNVSHWASGLKICKCSVFITVQWWIIHAELRTTLSLNLNLHFISGDTRKSREHFQYWLRQRLWPGHKEKTSISGHALEDHVRRWQEDEPSGHSGGSGHLYV